MSAAAIPTCSLFVNGEWIAPTAGSFEPVYNPSDGTRIGATPLCGADEIGRAVRAAELAYPAWSETPPVERARLMFRYKQLLEEHFEELARSVTRENGKTLDEARGSVRRGIEVVEFACGIPSLLMGETIENIAPSIDCDTVRQPLGVCAAISPFNFPVMVPMWTLPIALACGNTFVLKPSEKVPLSAVRMMELLAASGLPPGVCNLVHGGREAVDALLIHPAVRAVSFVGSTPVAKHVYETAALHGKRVQSSGGAKNAMVVMPDADVESAVAAILGSAYGCAGERCMAGSVLIPVGDVADRLLPRLIEAASALRVGPTDRDPSAQMGPLVTRAHLDRAHGYIASGVAEGARLLLDGRSVRVPEAPGGFYLGPTIFDGVDPGMRIAREEIFGPVLSVMRAPDLAAAVALCDGTGYGNAAVIFTSSGGAAREFRHRVGAGMVGVNIGVPAPMAFFPFSGWNASFFGDLHVQGREGVAFFTRQKVTISRWVDHGKRFF
jgi:malonate-semialdehyde dehydrogenase (acetylating)/methylmalonate-semialdehyde dehydrogenase